jgi:outer membrane receptor protein involved in Fe transport
MNGRMTLNGSVFYIDWRNMQTLVALSCGFGLTINAGKAVSKGAEVEASLHPLTSLTVNGAMSFVDATLRESVAHAPGQAGDRLPFASKWSWNLSAEYEHEIANGYRGFVRGEVNYVGDRWSTFESVTARARLLPSYTTFNARVGVGHDNWSVAVFGANLTDEHVITSTQGTNYWIVGTPRTVGVKLEARF